MRATYLGVGSLAHDPGLMLKIALFEVLEGHLSPSQWARHVGENDPLRWLGQGIKPSRSALYTFRDRLSGPVFELHVQAIQTAIAEGLTTAESAVQDGTSVRAGASRHQLLNQDTLTSRSAKLVAAIAQDAAGQPIESPPYWMPDSPSGRRELHERYQQARVELAGRLATNQKRPKDKRLPDAKVKISVTDPEAPLGRDKEKVFGPIYTPQFIVDTTTRLILSFDVFAQATDAGTLPLMLDRTQEVTGVMLNQISTDSAYASLLDLQACQARGVRLVAPVQENDFTAQKRANAPNPMIGKDQFEWLPDEQTYRCPMGHLLNYKGEETKQRRDEQTVIQLRFHCPAEHCRGCPLRDRCVKNPDRGRTVKRLQGEELIEAHKAFMSTAEAKGVKRLRGSVVEARFGDAKYHRNLRRFHGRGLAKVKAETGLVVLAQVALTLARLRKKLQIPEENAA